jgi:hypothetical protein
MAIGVWACSQGDAHPPFIPDQDSSTKSDATGDAKSDAPKQTCATDDGGCNALVNCAPKVNVDEVAQNPPVATGGIVPDGTYLLTAYSIFTGPGGSTAQNVAWFEETMTFATPATADAGASDGGDGGDGGDDAGTSDAGVSQATIWEDISATNISPISTSVSGVADFAGDKVVITHTCPNSTIFSGNYTVSSTQLVLYAAAGSGTAQLTYTKQ